jgi:hypothetical protein
MDIDIRHLPDSGTFEAQVQGRVAGHLYYRQTGEDGWLMYSTVVDPDMEGRGVGSALCRAAVSAATNAGKRVDSTCWFVSGWIQRHPEAVA